VADPCLHQLPALFEMITALICAVCLVTDRRFVAPDFFEEPYRSSDADRSPLIRREKKAVAFWRVCLEDSISRTRPHRAWYTVFIAGFHTAAGNRPGTFDKVDLFPSSATGFVFPNSSENDDLKTSR
jgi:hypothetical protein